MADESDIAVKRQEDFDDLQRELSGQDVGRIGRFLSEGDVRPPDAKRKKAEREHARRTLAMLLEDPIYRARYDDTMAALRRAEAATERVIEELTEQLGVALSALQQIEDNAARLPDGTMVFRDEAGVVRRADGSALDDALVSTIVWDGDEPSFEDYVAANEQISSLQTNLIDVGRYQTDVLGTARGELTDERNPPSLEEIDRIFANIEHAAPHSVTAAMPNEHSATSEPGPVSYALPTLGN